MRPQYYDHITTYTVSVQGSRITILHDQPNFELKPYEEFG